MHPGRDRSPDVSLPAADPRRRGVAGTNAGTGQALEALRLPASGRDAGTRGHRRQPQEALPDLHLRKG